MSFGRHLLAPRRCWAGSRRALIPAKFRRPVPRMNLFMSRESTVSAGSLAFALVLAACSPAPVPATAAHEQPPPSTAKNRLLFAGDVMLCREVGKAIQANKNPALPFERLAALLSSADIAFINLESPFADKGPRGEVGMVFRAHPETVAGLVLAGIDVVSVANNHARDCGDHGVIYTLNLLQSNNIEPVGIAETEEKAHRGVVLIRHGVRFGFLGYTYDQSNGNWRDVDKRIALADPDVMERDVHNLLKRADLVIVSMHHGIEYMKRPSPKQMEFAHRAIDAGAVLVVGHHPHVSQSVERYRNGVIFYSLGNFIFDQFQRVETQHGIIADVMFSGTAIANAATIPVRILSDGPELEPPRELKPANKERVTSSPTTTRLAVPTAN
jgi:poly-gamma-glutamate capsule biosynthesis protein CapA/YwtB (metallophosphatase superfamily)